MIRRLAVLAGLAAVAVGIAFADILPTGPLIGLAVLGWGVWFAMARADRSPR